jgi:hypothetical protein
MPRFSLRSATADVMSGSDCAEGFAWQFRADNFAPSEKYMAVHNSGKARVRMTSEQNIKLHRMHMMKKMGVESLADLVRAAERLDVSK